MDLSAIGRTVLIAREGRRLTAYRDSVGVWTIGIGHTSAAGPPVVTPGLRLTEEACDDLFVRDLAAYVRCVARTVPEGVPDHAFDALVSLCFNIGPAAFARSTVARCLKAGDRAGAAEAILLWNRPAALIPRRGAEYDQFRTPYSRALPRARRGDAAAISAPRPDGPPQSAPRRTLPPARPPLPARPGEPTKPAEFAKPAEPGAGRPGAWLRLWSALRTRARPQR